MSRVGNLVVPFTVLASLVLSACAPAVSPPAAATVAPKPTVAPAPASPKPAAAPGGSPSAPSPSPGTSPAASPLPAGKPAATFDQQAVAEFYRGKTLRVAVGFAAGGGYDTYSRVIAKYLGKYIPGNPTVIVENVPGAGSATLANQLYNQSPKDGTVVGTFVGFLLLQKLVGQPNLEFDIAGWNFLGAPAISEYVCTVQDNSGFTGIREVMNPGGKELIAGSIPGSGEAFTQIVKEVLNANFKIVSGYSGTAPVRLAMEQGEVHGNCVNDWGSLLATSLDDLKTGKQRVILQMITNKKLSAPQGDAPTAYEFAKSDEDKLLVRTGIENPGIYARIYAAPPGTPGDRALALRQAFDATMKDPEFLADTQRANLEINPATGEQLERLVQEAAQIPESLKARLRRFILAGS